LGSNVPGYRSHSDDLGMALLGQTLQPQQSENVIATGIGVKKDLSRLASILCGVNHIRGPDLAGHYDAHGQQ